MDFASFSSLVEQIAATIDRKVTGSRAAAIRPSLQGNFHQLEAHRQELQTLTDYGHGQTCLHDQYIMEVNRHDFRSSDDIDSNTADFASPINSFQYETYGSDYQAYAADQRRRAAPTVNKQVWDSFSDGDKTSWGGISPDGRYKIWDCFKERALQSRSPPETSTAIVPINGQQSANLNAITPILAGTGTNNGTLLAGEHRVSFSQESNKKKPPPQDNESLLINAARSKSQAAETRIQELLNERPIGSRPIGSITPAHFTAKKSDGNHSKLSIFQHKVTYNVSLHNSTGPRGALIDRGANGGVAGDDVRPISWTDRKVDVTGLDNHEITDLRIGCFGGVAPTQRGDVIVIMYQYAHGRRGKTIHSSAQLEHYKIDVNDKSLRVGGLQHIKTPEGYVFPINIINGLPYVPFKPFTDRQWKELPHVIWTSDAPWDPSCMDVNLTDKDDWHQSISDIQGGLVSSPFDEYGEYRKRTADPELDENDHYNYHGLRNVNATILLEINRHETKSPIPITRRYDRTTSIPPRNSSRKPWRPRHNLVDLSLQIIPS